MKISVKLPKAKAVIITDYATKLNITKVDAINHLLDAGLDNLNTILFDERISCLEKNIELLHKSNAKILQCITKEKSNVLLDLIEERSKKE